MNNLQAGIGDPYWYEWLVGVDHALDMLPQDNNISYVAFQASEFQGLDDVVIGYKDGTIHGIQVKHTRKNDSLTFADLVSPPSNKCSLLSVLFTDWLNMRNSGKYIHCSAELITNKIIGTVDSTVGKKTTIIKVPALDTFWNDIKNQLSEPGCVSIEDIKVNAQWADAWKLFLNQLITKDNKVKFDFLKSLKISANKENLSGYIDAIKNKLFDWFKCDSQQILQLEQRLCYAIRKWSTTLRHSEKITREDLYEALSLVQDIQIGEHNLPVCNPFFHSRDNFVETLEQNLKQRIAPIIFLSGNPGSGKTNIINYMADKSFSVIDLRFHAFKPVQPGDSYLPNDHGLSDPNALWGDLLIQLRCLLRGRLSEFNVPVSNEILGSYEKIRTEVLRIAQAYGKKENRVVTIAIDGIDHAARSGADNNFLTSLVPPAGILSNVCFLIAGQPLQYYDLYPDWLSDEESVFHCTVPMIEKSDILQMLIQKQIEMANCTQERIAEIIWERVCGNTLSAVFAVYECENIQSLEDLELRLRQAPLNSGIQAYYEYIWKEGKKIIPQNYRYIDTKIAAVLSMYTKPVTPEEIMKIFNEISITVFDWERILKSLFPIVIQDSGGFRILHNDVSVYLQKYVRKDLADFQKSCFDIARFLFTSCGDINLRHEIGFELLSLANRQDLLVHYFTTSYVLDSIFIKRPLSEIAKQFEVTLSQFSNSLSIEEQISFECALATLSQYQQSLKWQETHHMSAIKLPSILPCERRVLSQILFSSNAIEAMLCQVDWLIDENQYNRANDVFRRWLGETTPFLLFNQLTQNEGAVLNREYLNSDYIKCVIEHWGAVSFRLELPSYETTNEPEKKIIAYWSKGWLKNAQKCYSPNIIRRWEETKIEAFVEDIENMFVFLLRNAENKDILNFISSIDKSEFTYPTKVYWVCWAIIHNEGEHCVNELDEILTKGIDPLTKHQYGESNSQFTCGVIIAFILKTYGQFDLSNFEVFLPDLLEKSRGHSVKPGDRGYSSGNNIVLSGILLSEIFSNMECNNNDSKKMDMIIKTIFDECDGIGSIEIGETNAKKFLLELLIFVSNKFPTDLYKKTVETIVCYACNTEMLTTTPIWWPFLKKKGMDAHLLDIFKKWFDLEKGIAWQHELYETHNIASIILPLALEMGWDEEVDIVQDALENYRVGYTGRKEYSLNNVLTWFEALSKDQTSWQHPGIDFLNISDYASKMGDNRAAVRINGAVAAIVGNKGVSAIDTFIRIINPSNWNEFQIILDAIIESFSNYEFSNDEILLIWETVVSLLQIDHSLPEYNSNNLSKIIYLVDLRVAIFEYLKKVPDSQKNCLMGKMAKSHSFEYQIEKGPETTSFYLPNRWFLHESENSTAQKFYNLNKSMSLQIVFDKIKEEIISKSYSRWDMAIGFLDILNDSLVEKKVFVDKLFALTVQYREPEVWEYDGIYCLYEKIWNLLSLKQKSQLFSCVVEHYHSLKKRGDEDDLPYLYLFCDDVHRIISWQIRDLSEMKKIKTIESLLSMHKSWITASERRPFISRYKLINEESNTTWIDVCQFLKEQLSDKL